MAKKDTSGGDQSAPPGGEATVIELHQAAPAAHETDYLVYVGPIARSGYETISRVTRERADRATEVAVVLATYGGDPDAAYRISRCLRHHYKKLTVLLPTYCKSAGTLVCTAADELVVFDMGELGPLDMQPSKPDEIAEYGSGLDSTQAFQMLNNLVINAFQQFVLDVRFKNNLSTKIAAEIAAKLALGVYSPIFAQIDPIRVAEVQRAINIVYHYGTRLSRYGNILREGMLVKLMHSYPSHPFVIDRKEAAELFKAVRAPTHLESEIGLHALSMGRLDSKLPVITYVQPPIGESGETRNPNDASNAATGTS